MTGVMNFKTVLRFGKHKGKTIGDVYDIDPSYLEWVLLSTNMITLSPEDFNKIMNRATDELFNKTIRHHIKGIAEYGN